MRPGGILLLLFILPSISKSEKPCRLLKTGDNDRQVCVCNKEYCDTTPTPPKVAFPEYVMYTSSKAGLRFDQSTGKFKNKTTLSKVRKIYIDHDQEYQTIRGFGGSFTDAAGINIKSLEEEVQNFLLKSYFSEDGIEYSLCRVPIGGSDFSTHAYTYDDTEDDEEDPNLENFKLQKEDYEFKIPFMLKARELNKNLKFLASPWGAPKWMKTNNELSGKGRIMKKFYQTWADYFLKFLEEYARHGLDFQIVTTQNEPSLACPESNLTTKDIMSVCWSTSDMAKWMIEHLGPTIKNSVFRDVKICILDDQTTNLPWYVIQVLKNPETRKYVDCIAIHWYLQNFTSSNVLQKTHDKYPDLNILSTEACTGYIGSVGVALGSWERGEKYSTVIIEDLLHWVSSWTDWNLVLDLEGGPNYIDNFVDAPVVVDSGKNEFYKQPMYYHMGHFSKFIPPGSVRVGVKTDLKSLKKNVTALALRRPDKAIVVVILNKFERDVELTIQDDLMGSATLKIDKKSINTLLYYPRSIKLTD